MGGLPRCKLAHALPHTTAISVECQDFVASSRIAADQHRGAEFRGVDAGAGIAPAPMQPGDPILAPQRQSDTMVRFS